MSPTKPSIPELPSGPHDGAGTSRVAMRYEDVAQNGRLLVESLATSVNETLWNAALREHPLEQHAFAKGTLAILTRFVVETYDGPFSVDGPFDAEARLHLAHGLGKDGQVDRIYLNGWVDTYAPIGRTNFAPPPNAGERTLVGRAFAEHVFTRPFAPIAERRVTRLEIPGVPQIPGALYQPEPPSALGIVPAGVEPLDSGLSLDSTPLVFGLRHTDSNQHVNSLVYPQHFEEAVLRRLARLGHDTRILGRTLEIGYRKPLFAGQTAHVAVALYRDGETIGASGAFYAEEELARAGGLASAVPNAFVRMSFTRG